MVKLCEYIPDLVNEAQPPKDTPSRGRVSRRKLEANGENAQSSTAPKTHRGKRKSRSNAWKHGLTAEVVVLEAGENAADFESLVTSLYRELQPAGALEQAIIRDLAYRIWKQQRVRRGESVALRGHMLMIDRKQVESWLKVLNNELGTRGPADPVTRILRTQGL